MNLINTNTSKAKYLLNTRTTTVATDIVCNDSPLEFNHFASPAQCELGLKFFCSAVTVTANLVSLVKLCKFFHFLFLQSSRYLPHAMSENVNDLMQNLEHGLGNDL